MARPRKESIPLNIKMDKDVCERLVAYCNEVGQTKTTAVERALSMYMDEYYKRQQSNTAKQS